MLIRYLQSLVTRQEISRPIFIIGCGRSGTTLLGTVLSRHNRITYLNEPRDLWFGAYPQTDIWTSKACARNGKLVLTAEDTNSRQSRKLRRRFFARTMRTNRPVLVEKLPINTFRLAFIKAIFPDAGFIHLFRNGLEVAASIARMDREGRWFGAGDYKWQQLADCARNGECTSGLPELCDTARLKGLLEWRLSSESAVDFLTTLPEDRFMELSYRDLVIAPEDTFVRLMGFLGLTTDQDVLRYARDTVARNTDTLDDKPISERERIVGGELLPRSMDERCRSLTRPSVD